MKTTKTVIAALVVLALSPATVAHATKYWKNGIITGNWSPSNNWSAVSAAGADNGGVPVGGEAVNIVHTDGTAHTVTYDVNAPSLGLVSIDLTGPGTATNTLSLPNNNNLTAAAIAVGGYNGSALTNGRGAVNQSAGTTTISPGVDLIVGWGAGSTGTYTLSGGALVANQSEWVGHTGTGTFNHSAGTNTLNASALGGLFVGYNTGSMGTYNLSGTAVLSSNHDEYIGYNGNGTFNQTGGVNSTVGAGHHVHLGYNAGSTGTYTISGGRLTVGNDLIVGNSGTATGTLTIQNNSSVYVTNNLWINSQSTVNLNGGTLRLNTVGGSGGLSRLNYTAGTIQLAGDRTIGTDATINELLDVVISIVFLEDGKSLAIEGDTYINRDTYVSSGSTLTALDSLFVVDPAGNTSLVIESDGTVIADKGAVVNRNNEVVVRGANASWTVSSLRLGFGIPGQFESPSPGRLEVTDQAVAEVGFLDIGPQGTVTLHGGTIRMQSYDREAGGAFNFISGTIDFGSISQGIGNDENVKEFFGDVIVIPAGKGLAASNSFYTTFKTTVTVDGGTLTLGDINDAASHLILNSGTFNVLNQNIKVGPVTTSVGTIGEILDLGPNMTVNSTLGITNSGLITGDGEIGGPFTNAVTGELRAQAGRSLRLTGSGNSNAGQIKLLGGELEFTQNLTNNVGGFISGNGSLIVGGGLVNQGTMNFAGTANIDGAVTNAPGGKIISGGGGATIFYDDVINNGEIRTSTNGFTVFFGSASGSGTFTGTGTVNFEGDLSPGSSPAAVSFAGDVVLGPDSTLQIELGGTAAGTQYDQINVAGELTLGGTLEISLINGFTPSAGQSFDILNWGSLSGAFSLVALPSLEGLAWDTSQLATGILSVAPGLPGDFNLDGSVDAADYVVWRKTGGTQDGYNTWRTNFGQTAANGSGANANAAVPEPGTLVQLLAGMLATCFCRRTAVS